PSVGNREEPGGRSISSCTIAMADNKLFVCVDGTDSCFQCQAGFAGQAARDPPPSAVRTEKNAQNARAWLWRASWERRRLATGATTAPKARSARIILRLRDDSLGGSDILSMPRNVTQACVRIPRRLGLLFDLELDAL